jgi:hypothetical protein
MKKFALLAVMLSLIVVSMPGVAAAQTIENGTADVYVIHGIPGEDVGLDPALPVDVLVNEAICLLEGFTFGEQVGPVALDEGTYNIQIKLADDMNPCTGPTVIEADVPFVAGETATVIAHLAEDLTPTASKFTLDVSRIGQWLSRLGVYHTAAAPAVDVEAYRVKSPGRVISLENVANGQGGSVNQVPGEWMVTIFPAGSPDPVFGPFSFTLERFTAHFVYAVGSLQNGTFQLLVQEIDCRFNPR